MAKLAIGEVARRFGLRASALRFYEARNLIPVPVREGGRRVYEANILDRLAVIELAKSSGFTITEIERLLQGLDRRKLAAKSWRRMAQAKLAELERRIEETQRMKALLNRLVECECPTLEDCGRALNASRTS